MANTVSFKVKIDDSGTFKTVTVNADEVEEIKRFVVAQEKVGVSAEQLTQIATMMGKVMDGNKIGVQAVVSLTLPPHSTV